LQKFKVTFGKVTGNFKISRVIELYYERVGNQNVGELFRGQKALTKPTRFHVSGCLLTMAVAD